MEADHPTKASWGLSRGISPQHQPLHPLFPPSLTHLQSLSPILNNSLCSHSFPPEGACLLASPAGRFNSSRKVTGFFFLFFYSPKPHTSQQSTHKCNHTHIHKKHSLMLSSAPTGEGAPMFTHKYAVLDLTSWSALLEGIFHKDIHSHIFSMSGHPTHKHVNAKPQKDAHTRQRVINTHSPITLRAFPGSVFLLKP